ncbi:glycosyltransferase family 2 protein [Bizionia argentinensis JUB59]|uniref:Glycosyltransferase family 2 protein n=1 Tax=Bizionia argentinensis JUB59 TaxID=1046627 RepID=G2EAS5_9FLAO|nr:glycosyltransferase family A protein [Bizionia argentinensis]EGV44389.1 glycosyltransferase family 2 protein [Bizionia argentinensis JUB59]
MRTGSNPQKSDYKVSSTFNHRIVQVIYIPELSGYYKKMFEVFKLSIFSLIKTIPKSSAITIVDNGSCNEVKQFLIDILKQKKINSLQLLETNIGKIDAQIGAARASREDLITLSDGDILFRKNWVEETFKVFERFSNVSSVAPYPSRHSSTYFTFSTLKSIFLKKNKLEFESIPENLQDYNRFLNSINWGKVSDKNILWPVVKKNGFKACLGSEHQVITLRRQILFNFSPLKPSFIKVGNHSEMNYVDLPIDLSKGLRLSTYNYFAHHMGNEVEGWMEEIYNELNLNTNDSSYCIDEMKFSRKNILFYKLQKKLLKIYIKRKTPSNY